MAGRIDEALDGLSRRELEALAGRITTRLAACALCGNDGAVACRVTAKLPSHTTFSLLLCRPCIERHRLPEGRSAE